MGIIPKVTSLVTPYNLRKSNLLTLPKIKLSSFGINSLLFRGIIPDYLKSLSLSLSIFKWKIENKKLARRAI